MAVMATALFAEYSFSPASTKPSRFGRLVGVTEPNFQVAKEIKDRLEELQGAGIDLYPRDVTSYRAWSLLQFERDHRSLKEGEIKKSARLGSCQGRIESVRTAGRLLFFVDMVRKNLKLQVLVNYNEMPKSSITEEDFVARRKLLRRGDIIRVTGYPHRTKSGQLSLSATDLPRILSPCLHQFPVSKSHEEVAPESAAQFLDRHVDMLANHETTQVLLRRYQIMREMRNFLNHGGFVEVQTPILSTAAGGAVARPFATSATEFADKQLSLRIAPELWLKRLILGGMDRIFEIGPCFRNEGLDKFHNPEFTTCEFYNAYATLQDLLKITEMMLYTIVNNVQALSAKNPGDPNRLPRSKMPPLAVDADFFKGPYPRIDFISALNEALGRKLPALGVESATRELVEIFQEKNIPLPAQLTLPRLLDKLSATYLEPQCDKPTWIINHPECLSPLSKSFFHTSPSVDQPVAARAELFVRGHEIVNCYEEENSPFEQRRKFMMQQQHAKADGSGTADPEAMKVDEEYLRALEWGLPPTGGWGCGIDRLVMLIIGKQRIGDVLAFGNLRSVTRIPGPREMAGLARSPIPTLEEKRNQASVSEAQKQATTDIIQAPDPSDLGTETKKTNPEIDPVEEAVIKIRKDYRRESIRSKRRRGDSDSSSPGKKRLATWLAGRGGSDAAEWLISK